MCTKWLGPASLASGVHQLPVGDSGSAIYRVDDVHQAVLQKLGMGMNIGEDKKKDRFEIWWSISRHPPSPNILCNMRLVDVVRRV